MLVLRRARGQSIAIGKNAEIIIKVLHDINGVISLGIQAPKDILVDRLEVYEKRQFEPLIINKSSPSKKCKCQCDIKFRNK